MNLPSLVVQQNCRQEGDKLNSHTALETTFRFVISNCDAAAAVFVCCAHSRLPVIKINTSIPKRVLGIFFFSHHSATLLSEDSSFLTLSYLWALQCFYISGVCSRGGHEYWWSKGALSDRYSFLLIWQYVSFTCDRAPLKICHSKPTFTFVTSLCPNCSQKFL